MAIINNRRTVIIHYLKWLGCMIFIQSLQRLCLLLNDKNDDKIQDHRCQTNWKRKAGILSACYS